MAAMAAATRAVTTVRAMASVAAVPSKRVQMILAEDLKHSTLVGIGCGRGTGQGCLQRIWLAEAGLEQATYQELAAHNGRTLSINCDGCQAKKPAQI